MNFIIYEDEEKFVDYYERVIDKLLGSTSINYKVVKLDVYKDEKTFEEIKNIEGSKIYILDLEVPGMNGIELAKKIRDSGDWISPIIVVTSHEEYKIVGYTSKILMLDFIAKSNLSPLKDTLQLALKIAYNKPSLNFTLKGEYYQIPYEDILYIEKSLNNNSSIIVTDEEEYQINKTITELDEFFSEENLFFKSHRSCIVNIKKIKKVDFNDSVIYFKGRTINLLSRSNKKELRIRMGEV